MFTDKRRYPRFSYVAPVIFKLPEEALWSVGTLADISVGGVFLRTKQIVTDRIQVQFRVANLLDGIFVMVSGSIVRILDEAPYGCALGVEFTMPGSSPEIRRLCDYLMQNQQALPGFAAREQAASTFDMKKAIALARTIQDNLQFMNYYQLMGLDYTATTDQLVQMRNTLLGEMGLPTDGMLESERKVMEDALASVTRITDILCNPHKRLAYDLSQGQVDPWVVRQLAHEYNVDVRPFSAFWHQKFPDRVARAMALWQDSRQARANGQLESARTRAKESMELDPFNFAYTDNF